ncbi:MAG: hypothetical protein WKF82_07405 [Nocardioidaceae bacterium]
MAIEGYELLMTTMPSTPDELPPAGSEPAPDPGPIVPSGGEDSPPSIDPTREPGSDPQTDPDPDHPDDPDVDPAEGGLATRDADQTRVDREMARGIPPVD